MANFLVLEKTAGLKRIKSSTKEEVKQIVKNMKEQEDKPLNFVLNYLQGKFQPEEIKEILAYAGYRKASLKREAAEFDENNTKNKYYDNSGKDFRASNFKYELLPEFEKKQVQQLGRREVGNYIKNMIDMDDMVMDFQYDYGVTIPRGKFMEVFGMGEKEYTAAVEKAEKEAGINTGELIENNLFGTQFKKDKPQKNEEEFDFNDEPTVEALNKALDEYLAQPAPEKKSASTKKQAAFIHDKSEAYDKLNQAFQTVLWAEEQGLDKISGTDTDALKKGIQAIIDHVDEVFEYSHW